MNLFDFFIPQLFLFINSISRKFHLNLNIIEYAHEVFFFHSNEKKQI